MHYLCSFNKENNQSDMFLKFFQGVVLSALLVFCFVACGSDEPQFKGVALNEVEYVFSPFVTAMDSSSAIALPQGKAFDYAVINSQEALDSIIPPVVAAGDSLYQHIDFSKNTLLSIRFIFFYDVKKIAYLGYDKQDNHIVLHQKVYAVGPVDVTGRYVMSNLLVGKEAEGSIVSYIQSCVFEK